VELGGGTPWLPWTELGRTFWGGRNGNSVIGRSSVDAEFGRIRAASSCRGPGTLDKRRRPARAMARATGLPGNSFDLAHRAADPAPPCRGLRRRRRGGPGWPRREGIGFGVPRRAIGGELRATRPPSRENRLMDVTQRYADRNMIKRVRRQRGCRGGGGLLRAQVSSTSGAARPLHRTRARDTRGVGSR